MAKFKNGQRVKHIITGYCGVVVCVCEYFTGCARYSIQSEKIEKGGTPHKWQTFDEGELVSIGSTKKMNIKRPGGNLQHNPQDR